MSDATSRVFSPLPQSHGLQVQPSEQSNRLKD